jgi:hypothetical protein
MTKPLGDSSAAKAGLINRHACSDPRDNLDPSLVHRLEPRSLLLGILVWDGADEVVMPAVLIDLPRYRSSL